MESDNLFLPVHDKAEGDTLYSSCRELRLDFSPQYWGKFKTDQAVENAAGLLCIDKIHVYISRLLDGVKYRVFGYFVENDTFRITPTESEDIEKMPCDSFSFAVFIGCQPDGIRL